jgi:hypothetical protein
VVPTAILSDSAKILRGSRTGFPRFYVARTNDRHLEKKEGKKEGMEDFGIYRDPAL